MKIFGLEIKAAKPPTGLGGVKSPQRYSDIYFSRLGGIHNFDDNERIYIEEGYQKCPPVFSIVNQVAKAGGQAKWIVKSKSTKEIVAHAILDSWLSKEANPSQTWMDFVQDSLTFKMLTGNSFITFEYGESTGLPTYIYSLPPSEHIQINIRDDARGISSYDIDFAWTSAGSVPANEVVHLKNVQPDFDEADSNLFGQSPFRAARRSIQAYNESLDTGVWFLSNKGAQKMIVNDSDDELSPEAADSLKAKFRAQSQGPQNAGNIPIIDGNLKAIDISSNAGEALVLEQRKQAALEIANVTNFPPSLLGLSDSTYQNAKEAKKAMWENVIMPELIEMREGLNKKVIPLFGDDLYLDFEVDHIDALQEDKLMRGKALQAYAGVITNNEYREMAGIPLTKEAWGNDQYVGFVQSVADTKENKDDK